MPFRIFRDIPPGILNLKSNNKNQAKLFFQPADFKEIVTKKVRDYQRFTLTAGAARKRKAS